MTVLKEQVSAWSAALWAWLMKHALAVLAVVLACLFLSVAFSGKKSQEVKEVAEQAVVLKDKQVRQKDKVIAQKLDSIRTQTVIIKQIVHVRDSLKVVAKTHNHRADSLIKTIVHESPIPDPADTPERVEQLLTNYRPKAWAIQARDSLY
jgi:hypothetical protein